MLYFDRIDISEETDVNKTSASKQCDLCHCWYFLNCNFKFQPNVFNICHDLLMMSLSLRNIAILKIKGSDYWLIISQLLLAYYHQNVDLTEKNKTL